MDILKASYSQVSCFQVGDGNPYPIPNGHSSWILSKKCNFYTRNIKVNKTLFGIEQNFCNIMIGGNPFKRGLIVEKLLFSKLKTLFLKETFLKN